MRRVSGRLLSSTSLGVGSSGAHGVGDTARMASRHLLVAATNTAASNGGAGFVEICAEISSQGTQGREETALRPQRRRPRSLVFAGEGI